MSNKHTGDWITAVLVVAAFAVVVASINAVAVRSLPLVVASSGFFSSASSVFPETSLEPSVLSLESRVVPQSL